jgi:glycyl-tRNA synthetase beta chain
MDTLLLEIGSEEIPASYIEPALNAMAERLLMKMTEARIAHGTAQTFGTPKRLTVCVSDVSEKQQAQETEMTGPPERVAYDADGHLTIAGRKFAEKAGVPESELRLTETPKGRYLKAIKTEETLPTSVLLQMILPEVILAIPFPKSMRWADLNIHFARPIINITALLGSRLIPFELGNLQSNTRIWGHRFMNPGPFVLERPEAYLDILREAGVLADIAERKHLLQKRIATIATQVQGQVLPDDELVDTVNHLIEYPYPVVGKFDDVFLEIPREVLITAMREHQKYFAVVDGENRLMPFFIAVNNTEAKDMTLVAKGHERVLRARLADAQFFYHVDLKISSEDRVEKLKNVLFQAQLGSVYEKVIRVRQMSEYLADAVIANDEYDDSAEGDLKRMASRAAFLCKSDLVSQVVIEFTKLQGVMGKVYATIENEPPAVAAAIEEHYRPVQSGGELPATVTGALVAIADKIDSICGFFSVGLIPTGAADPYALRRQGIGMVQIMLDRNFSFSLKAMIETSLQTYGALDSDKRGQTAQQVYDFLRNRMAHLLEEEGFAKDVIAAVTSVSVDHVPHVWNRVRALAALKTAPDFEPLAVAFKRVVNIIRKADLSDATAVDEARFEETCESELYTAGVEADKAVEQALNAGNFDEALHHIAGLRDAVDRFFDGAMVMTDDAALRNNRLALLRGIAQLFETIADFSKIST